MSEQIQTEQTELIPELNTEDVVREAERLLKDADQHMSNPQSPKYDTKWGKNLPERRVALSETEVAAFQDIEQVLETKLNDEEHPSMPEVPVFSSNPTKASEAVAGVGGYKLDTGKARWELAPFDAFEAMVKVQTWAVDKTIRGERAYPERNWERGMAWSRVFGAMIRHAWKWWMGRLGIPGCSTIDEESGFSHAWHFFTCAGFLVAYELRDMKEFDDRPTNVADKPKV